MFSAAGSIARLIPFWIVLILFGVGVFFSGLGLITFVDSFVNKDSEIKMYGDIYAVGHITVRTNILRDTILTREERVALVERLDAKFKQDSLEYVNIFKD